MTTEAIKNDVIKIRIDQATQKLLEQARAYLNLDKSKFIRQSIQEKAQAVIAEHETTRFCASDWEMFFDMIDNPPEPTERMKKAAKLYKKIIAESEDDNEV
jgi:uncharacterized protein (DUF1778 family)